MKMNFDKDGRLQEPCLSCDNAYIEEYNGIDDIWCEWCCDEKECSYMTEREKKNDIK